MTPTAPLLLLLTLPTTTLATKREAEEPEHHNFTSPYHPSPPANTGTQTTCQWSQAGWPGWCVPTGEEEREGARWAYCDRKRWCKEPGSRCKIIEPTTPGKEDGLAYCDGDF
ncbi:hypothetical protein EJ03DRAFT_332557 [Teratosphaeria nubilosa]|uniref:Uncharacterized protein n=1 Tax=Teratosphaeria nubilosa TaxID=161662 RepID=A0A6G1KTD2_9PEZI|nr:hypothetical protein EJ03DRAFT_332557 [Teratosphaeria nubilosa]